MGSDASSKKDPENGFQITLHHAKTRHSQFKPPLILERHKDSYLFLPFIGKGLIPPELIRRLVEGQDGVVKSRTKFVALIREKYEVEPKVAEESIDWAVKEEEIKGIPGAKKNSPTRYESSTRGTGG